jgi:hypothetical protein
LEEEFKGQSKTVRIDGNSIVIKFAVWAHGFKGEKRIPFSSITSVQFREPGFMTAGYIQFGVAGALESTGGLMAAAQDENSVLFDKKYLEGFQRLRKIVEQGCEAGRRAPAGKDSSVADELAKLVQLKSDGHLSDEEFQLLKAKLLS